MDVVRGCFRGLLGLVGGFQRGWCPFGLGTAERMLVSGADVARLPSTVPLAVAAWCRSSAVVVAVCNMQNVAIFLFVFPSSIGGWSLLVLCRG